jgi:quercetin dioxygenase-like cupin family protein
VDIFRPAPIDPIIGGNAEGQRGEETMQPSSKSLSYAVVAGSAAILSAAATYGAMTFVAPSRAQTAPAPTQRIDVMTQPLADVPGREVRITLLDLMPGHASPPHRHPNHHVFGYIVDGTYEWRIGDGPVKTFKPGDAFYEPPGVLHAVSRNASADARAKIVVFMVADAKQPSTVVEGEKK